MVGNHRTWNHLWIKHRTNLAWGDSAFINNVHWKVYIENQISWTIFHWEQLCHFLIGGSWGGEVNADLCAYILLLCFLIIEDEHGVEWKSHVGGWAMLKQCYHINTFALLTPGSCFLRSVPESLRGLIYSKWDGWTRISHTSPSSTAFPRLHPCHTYTPVPSLILGRISHFLTCFKADLHLGHGHSCPRHHPIFLPSEMYYYSSVHK